MREIKDAADQRPGKFPQMGAVIVPWQNAITFRKVVNTQVDGEVSQATTDIAFEGVMLPMRSQEIFYKTEGQRAWKWFTLYVRNQCDIEVGDTISDIGGQEYKVYKANQWAEAGFSVYDLSQDFETKGA